MWCFLFLIVLGHVEAQDHVLTNLPYFASGYDSLTGSPVMESLRLPIYQFTWIQNKTFYTNGQYYAVPDQLYLINDPSIDQTSTNHVFNTSYHVQTTMTQSYGSNSFIPGMYSNSEQNKFFQDSYSEFNYFTAFSNLSVSVWKVVMTGNVSFDSDYLTMLNSLPDEFTEQTCPIFRKFFTYYGTHGLRDAIYGGSTTMTTSFQMTLTQTKTTKQIERDLNRQFFLATTSQKLTYEQQVELDNLNQIYSSTFRLVGGDPATYQPNQYQQWAATVPNNPVIIKMSVRPHWENLSGKFRTALKNATINYLLSRTRSWNFISTDPLKNASFGYASDRDSLYLVGSQPTYRVELKNNHWHPLAGIPTQRKLAGVGLINNKIYVAGGIDHPVNSKKKFQILSQSSVYDISSNTWSDIAALPRPKFRMSSVVAGGTLMTFGGIIYVMESAFRWQSTNLVTIYNPTTNTWSAGPNMPRERVGGAAAVFQNQVYLFGGYYIPRPSDKAPPIAQVDMLDLTTMKWSTVSTMPDPRIDSSAVVFENRIYIIGGSRSTHVDIYDPIHNYWTQGPNMNIPKNNPAVATIGNEIYAIGLFQTLFTAPSFTEVLIATDPFC